jgi:predicted RNA binding protein YcfA (HicA-like mRNA interferase family)
MRRLRRVSGAEAIRALEQLGFKQVRQRGSHVIVKKETDQGPVGCVVPLHRDLAWTVGTSALGPGRLRTRTYEGNRDRRPYAEHR